MREQNDFTKGIAIAKPCQAAWDGMAGDEKVRHCTSCDLNVHNFAAMTRDEIGELLARAEGRVCGRIHRRADGTLQTSDRPSRARVVRDRLSRAASAMLALFGLAALATGCTTSGKARLQKHRSRVNLEVEQGAASQQALFEGVVVDETAAPLPGVSVVLQNEAEEREMTAITDAKGAFAIRQLSAGLYRIEATLGGFDSALVEHVPLAPSKSTRARIELRLDVTEMITVGQIVVDPAKSSNEISTTFTQDFISKLPL